MRASSPSRFPFQPSLPLILLSALLTILFVAGGASRPDVSGQVVVRATAFVILGVMVLFGEKPNIRYAPAIWWLLGAAIALPLVQLIPLPPGIWTTLPGRAAILDAAVVSGQPQPWRALSLSPAATVNALASLVVPLTALILVTALRGPEKAYGVTMLLSATAATTLLGLLQFSGGGLDNPFINESPNLVSGNFANRNHFALMLALGCVLAPAWAALDRPRPGWRGLVALGLVLLFMLTILASGSRAGLVLGAMGLGFGLVLSWQGIRRELRRFPRWIFPALIAAIAVLIASFVVISIAAGRAESINRFIEIDAGQDMRGRGLPIVLEMIRTYFPAGTGLGSFDPLFRLHEPFDLLKPTYFNHAHDDILEIVLDGGLPGLLLLLSALIWWGWTSFKVWRPSATSGQTLPRLGSALLFLVIVASLFDYPARTPMMMVVVILAGTWLAGRDNDGRASTLR